MGMKEDAVEYCDEAKIKELAGYYSEFLTHPIHVMKTETHQVPVQKDDEATEGDADEEDLAISDEDVDTEDAEPEMEDVVSQTWEIVNSNRPIWTREKDEIKFFLFLLSFDFFLPFFEAFGNRLLLT